MKLSYFGYSIKNQIDDKQYLFDMRPFVKAFCGVDSVAFKSQFRHSGEQLFLFHESGNLFLFLITRTNEIIKKISSKDLTVSEIYTALQQDEKLGFASYVHIESSYLGFASTIMAPRATVFAAFLEQIFQTVGLSDYQFVLHPLLQQSTRADAMKMGFLGRTSIQVNKENTVFEDMVIALGGASEDFVDVGSFEIIVKPKPRKNIDTAVNKILGSLPDAGLESFVVRAREELEGQLSDFYLIGQGHVSDTIKKDGAQGIGSQINEKIAKNQLLEQKVAKHEGFDDFEKKEPKSFTRFHAADAWDEVVKPQS